MNGTSKLLAAALCLTLSGCGGSKAVALGGQRLVRLDAPPVIQYSTEDRTALAAFSESNPELARKIVNQAQAMRKSLEVYDKLRWMHNARALRALGYSHEEIERIEGPDPGQSE